MEENASRAIFVGVSVFVAVITITIIVNFYNTARDTAAIANRFDITNTGNKYVNELLAKDMITGLELRYLLDYYSEDDEEIKEIAIYNSAEDEAGQIKLNISYEDYWSDNTQKQIDNQIRPNYNYELKLEESGNRYVIIAAFRY